jgi:hypothetical protein
MVPSKRSLRAKKAITAVPSNNALSLTCEKELIMAKINKINLQLL